MGARTAMVHRRRRGAWGCQRGLGEGGTAMGHRRYRRRGAWDRSRGLGREGGHGIGEGMVYIYIHIGIRVSCSMYFNICIYT